LNIEQPKFLKFSFVDLLRLGDREVEPEIRINTRIYPSVGPKTIIKVKRGKVLAELLKMVNVEKV
jgi:hypothetical protein